MRLPNLRGSRSALVDRVNAFGCQFLDRFLCCEMCCDLTFLLAEDELRWDFIVEVLVSFRDSNPAYYQVPKISGLAV